MAWTQADLDAVEKAMTDAVLSVTFPDGRSVSYRSMKDLQAVRDLMRAQLTAPGDAVRTTYAYFDRG